MRGPFLSAEALARIEEKSRKDPVISFLMDGPPSEVDARIEQLQMVGVDVQRNGLAGLQVTRVLKDGEVFGIVHANHLPTKEEFK